jgi:antitoxin ParD1/3/4
MLQPQFCLAAKTWYIPRMTEQFLLTLDSEAAERLKKLAAETGQSVEDLARQVLEGAARNLTGDQDLTALKTDIERGLADIAGGRVRDFDADRIIERGRKLLAGRSPSV